MKQRLRPKEGSRRYCQHTLHFVRLSDKIEAAFYLVQQKSRNTWKFKAVANKQVQDNKNIH